MNSKVAKLTGIRDSVLREHGIPFAEAIEQFRAWCGEDITILTWGFDDIAVLRENLAVHGMEADWASRWYNAQLIFNAQTDGSSNQKALKTALEIMEIEPSRPAHDALGDAYHTALICARLKLAEGIAAYEQSLRDHTLISTSLPAGKLSLLFTLTVRAVPSVHMTETACCTSALFVSTRVRDEDWTTP